MSKLCFDYGHGGEDPGATYNDRRESDDVLSLGKEVAEEVRRHGVIVDETRTSDATVSLNDRSNFENRNTYDYFISFHRNAYEPEKAKGAETYTYLNPGEKSRELAESIQASLVILGFVDRGVKEANYHVLRETKASAVLIEIGFIDNTEDNDLFDVKRNEIIKGLAKSILYELGIDYVEASAETEEVTGQQTFYRVMAGSYAIRENAENQVKKLNEAGFDATIMIFNK
ncbi:N-acetylmuramoyl-L-alanine amidase [Clostridium botulinum]|uniref:N-acetylmuramoyl-L-alanine amidase n=1 Tax=Clostridium botulinum TaxID=1491 RepID=UPI000773FF0A|nr:N-acetylmuramoyl-L-alanine amidase [Clostridium botulinum]MBN1048277.1 N-acetylmuramoyl-L-alanine amidase [Clostridium botulinum]MBN1077273.1 N-acetylmuramoyl-L-alanine amidase [Clostridium botulinum]NFE85575.1 N-acetylmuramoyl-L-alanine amidase [Clostridium botulinum]NFG36296.1 N-acetylmuramoyl-L-alanine amidase [Clostridium botulinum]NFN27736.1 N-acetylmuramoyl-L-alanine amidase [Clostridium botulinum]